MTKFTQRLLVEMGRDEWDNQFRLSVSGKGLPFSREQFSLPDSGQFLVGVGTFPGYSSQRQYALIRFNPLTKKIIYSASDPLSANDISWAYQQDIILLGVESQRVSQEEGFCTDVLLTYTPVTETVRVLLSLPQGECFDAFGLYSSHAPWYVSPEVWSPDNRYIAMTRGNGSDLCIINAETGAYGCISLPNREQWILSWAWSPDSNRVALLTRDGELFVYSVHEKSLIAIGKSDTVWEKLPSFLIWSSTINPVLPKP